MGDTVTKKRRLDRELGVQSAGESALTEDGQVRACLGRRSCVRGAVAPP